MANVVSRDSIQALKEHYGWGNGKLATALGVSAGTVTRWLKHPDDPEHRDVSRSTELGAILQIAPAHIAKQVLQEIGAVKDGGMVLAVHDLGYIVLDELTEDAVNTLRATLDTYSAQRFSDIPVLLVDAQDHD